MPDDRTYGFSQDDASALLQGIGVSEAMFPEIRTRGSGSNLITGKLDADLDVATAFADDPSTAVLSVWVKDSGGDYIDSGDNITVTNRFLYRSYTSGTICVVASINGEYRIIDSDCEAV